MFPVTRFTRMTLAALVAGAMFGAAALPAAAQESVYDHVVKPKRPPQRPDNAPTPGSGRPAAATLARNPLQWEIRGITGIKPDQQYSIYNLRRGELDLSSQLTFKERDIRDATGWGQNGGDFIFKRDTASTNVRDHRSIRDSEFVAIFNTKTRRYMSNFGVWEDKPQYIWMVKRQATIGEGRNARHTFALFNSDKRKWLMVCQGERIAINDDSLCLYDDTFKPFMSPN